MNYQKQAMPAYSGITINITNPTLNAASPTANCHPECCGQYGHYTAQHQPAFTVGSINGTPHNATITNGQYPPNYYNSNPYTNNSLQATEQYGTTFPHSSELASNNPYNENSVGPNQYPSNGFNNTVTTYPQNNAISPNPYIGENTQPVVQGTYSNQFPPQNTLGNGQVFPQNAQPNGIQQSYPPQYYLNNYNYIQNGERGNNKAFDTNHPAMINPNSQNGNNIPTGNSQIVQEEDVNYSKDIIENLNARAAEQKELEKNGKKTRITALTNEYIMSLENYLNNPNSEIRLMASKEVLKRLDEDKDRFDDAALNALLNKMLQDPNKLVRIAAMSAFASQLASGNNYTVTLLKNIQANPNSDKEDVIQAADILLKMSSTTEIKYVPAKKQEKSSNKELEASQKQNEQLRAQLQKYKEKEIEKMLQMPQGK